MSEGGSPHRGLPGDGFSLSFSDVGKRRRLGRVFPEDGRAVVVPIDDSLIFGPVAGLESIETIAKSIERAKPDAVLLHPGALRQRAFFRVPAIVNLTASTRLVDHTRKVSVADVDSALRCGADGVAVHINVSSRHESEMLEFLGRTALRCDAEGMPLVAIAYPRRETDGADDNYDELKRSDPEAYADLVAHCCRIAADLGADAVKTQFTGSVQSFARVVAAASGLPVLVAGGPLGDLPSTLDLATKALSAGASAVSFGRRVFSSASPAETIEALMRLMHGSRDKVSM